ncbi:unnamed protein product [Ilex paraguariensis]|uniref:Glabrous enhancer-binding protein-like DBD domain-containing protein n=1 Tax=Ilex paraguariensis TaxID=185542 RepID=A0ABC8RDN1_9AQUA
MASEEDHTVYNEDDLDEDEESLDEDHLAHPNDVVYDEDEDVDVDVYDESNSTSSSNFATVDAYPLPPNPPTSSAVVTVALAAAGDPTQSTLPNPKHRRINDVSITAAAATTVVEERQKPLPMDESRRLFQRLWTDEDEIELLRGFLEYNTSRSGTHNSSSHPDTTAFYDQIKSKLQLEFNKNQLVEKLRRLKKKYRNVLNRIESGKECVFKSPHDQATFEISQRIWSGVSLNRGAGGGIDDDDTSPVPNPHPKPKPNTNSNPNLIDQNIDTGYLIVGNCNHTSEKKISSSRKRSRGGGGGCSGGVKVEDDHGINPQPVGVGVATTTASPPIPKNLIEETVRSCVSPLFKELVNNVMNRPGGLRGFGMGLSLMPLDFGGQMDIVGGRGAAGEKWREQQILELEVYSKRLELVQDQIKGQLEGLRSMGR